MRAGYTHVGFVNVVGVQMGCACCYGVDRVQPKQLGHCNVDGTEHGQFYGQCYQSGGCCKVTTR